MTKRRMRSKLMVWLVCLGVIAGTAAAWSRFLAPQMIRGPIWGSPKGNSEADYKTTRERAEVVIAALERWKVKQGRYPVTLEELVPSELPRLDPPLVGKGVWEYGRPQAEVFELGFFVGPVYESDQYRSSTGKWTVDR